MFFSKYAYFVLDKTPYAVIITTKIRNFFFAIVIPDFVSFYLSFFFKYSLFFKKTMLYDIGAYDIPVLLSNTAEKIIQYSPVLWYLFKNFESDKLFVFILQSKKKQYKSIELLFRNAKWMEREVSEFFGFFFLNKSDRRCLFTIPLFYNFPLRKKYPTQGFYEIFFCPTLQRLFFKHINLLN